MQYLQIQTISYLIQTLFQFEMQNQQLIHIIHHIQSLQLMTHPNNYRSLQQSNIQLHECIQLYNQLLLQFLSFINLSQQSNTHSKLSYEALTQELEQERVIWQRDSQEAKDHVFVLESKIGELKQAIEQKQHEIQRLRVEIQDKQHRIWQIQNDSIQNINKMQQQLTTQLKSQYQTQQNTTIKNIQNIQNTYTNKLMQIQQQNKQYLNQNIILSNRLEELIRYIQMMQKNHQYVGDVIQESISPRIICRDNRENGEIEEIGEIGEDNGDNGDYGDCGDAYEGMGGRLGSQCRSLGCSDEDLSSQQKTSPQRMVLHEILGTQDRKSINFGQTYLSKPRQYQLSSIPNQNINSLNKIASPQQSTLKLNIIQQFNTNQNQIVQTETLNKSMSIEQKNNGLINPYQIFFTLLAQCAKIDYGNLEIASKVDLESLWEEFGSRKVPLHQWYRWMLGKIKEEGVMAISSR